ncbi:MAG: MFS transporter [Acidimicrobiia bacterium]|nr:MFS transporter [Acidimicrobiia bacterium]
MKRSNLGLGAAVTLAMILGGLLRAALPVLSTQVRAEFGLSRTGFGLVLTGYLAAIALSAPLAGRLADAFGGRRALLARFAAAALGILLIATAPNAWLVGVAVAFTGAGMAAGNPATNKLIADLVPEGRRGTLLGVKQSGGQFGVLLAGAILPALAGVWSWRGAVAVVVIVPVSGALLLAAAVPRDPERRTLRSVPSLDRRQRGPLVRFFVVTGLMGAAIQSVFGFLPLYASEALGFSLASAGLVAVVVAATSTIGRVVWARATERAGRVASPATALAATAALAVALVALAEGAGGWLLWVGAALLGASAESWNAVANVAVIRIIGPSATGRASGLMMFVTLAAGAVGPYAFGALADTTGSYTTSWLAAIATYLIAAAVALRWRVASR